MLGQTPTFQTAQELEQYCAANPTLQAGYRPAGQTNVQVLDCEEWPSVLPSTTETVVASPTTVSTCLQLFGASEPCIGPIGEYTLLALVALGLGVFWMAGRSR